MFRSPGLDAVHQGSTRFTRVDAARRGSTRLDATNIAQFKPWLATPPSRLISAMFRKPRLFETRGGRRDEHRPIQTVVRDAAIAFNFGDRKPRLFETRCGWRGSTRRTSPNSNRGSRDQTMSRRTI
ncbi:MAG: hypothetical protein ABUL62_23255 [Myxococcales bacterium]